MPQFFTAGAQEMDLAVKQDACRRLIAGVLAPRCGTSPLGRVEHHLAQPNGGEEQGELTPPPDDSIRN